MRSIISTLVLCSIALFAQTAWTAEQISDNEKAPEPRGGHAEAEQEEYDEYEGLRDIGVAFVAVLGPLLTVGTLIAVAWGELGRDATYAPVIALGVSTVVVVAAGIPMWIVGGSRMRTHASLDLEQPPPMSCVQVALVIDREGVPAGAGLGWSF